MRAISQASLTENTNQIYPHRDYAIILDINLWLFKVL